MTIITRHYDENGREIQIDTDDSIVMSVSEQVDLMNRICEVRNENDRLKAENEKLRKLIRDMWGDIPKSEACAWLTDANCCTGGPCIGECSYWYRMHKLGIEVDD